MIVRCPSACGSSTGASGSGAPPPWLIGLAGSSGASILSGGRTYSTSGVKGGVSSSPSSSIIHSFSPVTLLTGFGCFQGLCRSSRMAACGCSMRVSSVQRFNLSKCTTNFFSRIATILQPISGISNPLEHLPGSCPGVV